MSAEAEKQIEIEKSKLELERVHKEEERKRELEHQDLILQQQIKFEKTQAEKSIDRQVKNVKLPKLSITKFSGKYIIGQAFVLEHLRSRDRLKRAAVHVEVWLSKGTACWNRKCDLK